MSYTPFEKWYTEKFAGECVGTQGQWRHTTQAIAARMAWDDSRSELLLQLATEKVLDAACASGWIPSPDIDQGIIATLVRIAP